MSTKSEKAHMDAVAALGCIACHQQGHNTPAEIHHIRAGMGLKRATSYQVIPLCPAHHRGTMHPLVPSIHLDKRAFIKRFGSEASLLEEVHRKVEV